MERLSIHPVCAVSIGPGRPKWHANDAAVGCAVLHLNAKEATFLISDDVECFVFGEWKQHCISAAGEIELRVEDTEVALVLGVVLPHELIVPGQADSTR